jgi:hypothetical protein
MAVLAGMEGLRGIDRVKETLKLTLERDRDRRGSGPKLERNDASWLHDAFLIPSQGVL